MTVYKFLRPVSCSGTLAWATHMSVEAPEGFECYYAEGHKTVGKPETLGVYAFDTLKHARQCPWKLAGMELWRGTCGVLVAEARHCNPQMELLCGTADEIRKLVRSWWRKAKQQWPPADWDARGAYLADYFIPTHKIE